MTYSGKQGLAKAVFQGKKDSFPHFHSNVCGTPSTHQNIRILLPEEKINAIYK